MGGLRLVWGFALIATFGCGPDAGIFLSVEAPFQVPAQCDALHVRAFRGSPNGTSLYDHAYPLAAGDDFPLTLTLVTSNNAEVGSPVFVDVQALRDGGLASPCAEDGGTATLATQQLVPLTVSLCAGP